MLQYTIMVAQRTSYQFRISRYFLHNIRGHMIVNCLLLSEEAPWYLSFHHMPAKNVLKHKISSNSTFITLTSYLTRQSPTYPHLILIWLKGLLGRGPAPAPCDCRTLHSRVNLNLAFARSVGHIACNLGRPLLL